MSIASPRTRRRPRDPAPLPAAVLCTVVGPADEADSRKGQDE